MRTLLKSAMGAVLAAFAFAATPSQAAVLSMAGDSDCFGLGGSCPAGALWESELGGTFFYSYASVGEAPFTDYWGIDLNPSYSLAYAGGTNVSVELKIAGIADSRGPWDVLFNGTQIGQLSTDTSADAFEQVRVFNFDIAAGLLQANNVVTFNTDGGDGYSVDYVSLLGDRVGTVPEPATWAMLLLGFGAIGLSLRSRRSQAIA